MSYQQLPINPFSLPELGQASEDYWLKVRGCEAPPAPSFRMVDGKQRLGQYLDPYGCLSLMQSAKHRWTRWYTSFLLGLAFSLLFVEVDWFFLCLAIIPLTVWYLIKRARLRAQFDRYYAVLEKIQRTGEPVWVPYDQKELKMLGQRHD